MLSQGHSTEEVAGRLFVSPTTDRFLRVSRLRANLASTGFERPPDLAANPGVVVGHHEPYRLPRHYVTVTRLPPPRWPSMSIVPGRFRARSRMLTRP